MRKPTITKADIIKTAIIMIEKNENLSFSTISRRMKITSQSLYNYFKNQRELEYAIIANVVSSTCKIAQKKVFGQSGHEGIISLALIFRTLGVSHINLAQFVISHPRTQEYPNVNLAFDELKTILEQMLGGSFKEKQLLKASRLVRNLVIGDILNVGMGWFKSPSVDSKASFIEMLELGLNSFKRNN